MAQSQDPAGNARELLDELGLDGIVQAGARAEACRREGDGDGLRYWTAVARSIRLLADGPEEGSAEEGLNLRVQWRLMQRVEHFRHRAAECRRRAVEAPDTLRGELLAMERHWLELATYAEVLTGRA